MTSWIPEGARGWLLVLVVLVLGSAFVLGGQLTGQQWLDLARWLVGLYFAGAAGQAVAKPAGELLSARAAETVSRLQAKARAQA